MSNYISREAASADECKHKIKTPFARIVVEGIPEKPYYNIWYFNPADGECHIGFGSYCLDNVFNWLAEEFEITEPRTDVEPVRYGKWIGIDSSFWKPTHSSDIPVFRKTYRCSECRRRTAIAEKYCPNCGAKMDKEEK
jgi:hypothetical protein